MSRHRQLAKPKQSLKKGIEAKKAQAVMAGELINSGESSDDVSDSAENDLSDEDELTR